METSNNRFLYWVLIILAPVVFIAGIIISDQWYWGLMDDFGFFSNTNSWIERFVSSVKGFMTFGIFRPTLAAYVPIFYPLFKHSPTSFYIFRLIFSVVSLFIWGGNAAIFSRKKTAIFLVPAISLTFYFFYDSFYYLSI